MNFKFKLSPPPEDTGTGAEYSPFSSLLLAVQERVKAMVPEIRFIDRDKGQLEDEVPAVDWPCLLISFDEFDFTDAGDGIQEADGLVLFRIAMKPYSKSSSIQPLGVRIKALSVYDLEAKLYKALHNWKPDKYGALLRRKSIKENRPDDGLDIRRVYYQNTFMDYSAQPVHGSTQLPPDMEFEAD